MKLKPYLIGALIAIGIALVTAYVAVKSFVKDALAAIFRR